MTAATAAPPRRWLRKVATAQKIGKHEKSLDRLMKDHGFPRPVRIDGIGRAVWDEGEVEAWMERQLKARASA
ncbi:MAG TPA: AlpA family phage regulatory protein [Methylocella sp.]|jgi:predicted DNA-binding transcriptional regulator AlpA